MLGQHVSAFGTAPDRRLFRGARRGMLSESVAAVHKEAGIAQQEA
jgi:hypothetical protein